VTFMALFSASARSGFHSFFLTVFVRRSVSVGSFSKASLNLFSAASSVETRSRASSGQNSTHSGSPSQRSQAMALPVSELIMIPPCGQAWTHQSQPLHCFSLTMSTPVFSLWTRAFSGQALTHGASSQNLHARAKLNNGAMRITRILDFNGFPRDSPFSNAQAYSQIPQPVHLLGSTETNFLDSNLARCIFVFRTV
jgi:hypothetical protein